MNIYKAIGEVMKDVGAVGKDSRNPQQGYRYRGIDAVMNALQPAMIKHHIFVVPEVMEQTREERKTSKGSLLIYSILKIKYTFYADDGTSVEAVVIGEGMDSGDKATNKALSVGFKYACFQVFCIPTEEMIDSEVDSPEPVHKDVQTITEGHAEELKNLLQETDTDPAKFLKAYKSPSVDEMTEAMYEDAVVILRKRKEKNQ